MLVKERATQDVLDSIQSGKLNTGRLQRLHYALKHTRQHSLYRAWTDADAAEVIEQLESLLPRSKRLQPAAEQPPKRHKTIPAPLGVDGPLSVFARSLPYRPYVSNDLEYGLQITSRGQADLFRYIQHNPPTKCAWIVLDCDFPGALAKATALGLPAPNFVATNPENGHSHLYYGLEDPVCISDAGINRKPAWILQRVEFMLGSLLGSDVAYAGFISKNLLNPHWLVECVREKLWKLTEFQGYFELPVKLPKKALDVGVGRNVTLFEGCRPLAYKAVLGFRLTGDKRGFEEHMFSTVSAKNLGFAQPLLIPEVRSIARSIARWTWRYYTGRLSNEDFSKRQAARGKLGGLTKGRANAEKRAEARLMASKGMTQRAIAESLQVALGTVNSWLRA